MKVDDGISAQGAFLVNRTPKVHQGIFVERRKLCLCGTIQFHKPSTQEVTRLELLLLVSMLNSENRALLCTPKVHGPKYMECTLDINFSALLLINLLLSSCLRHPESSLSGLKINQKVSPVISLLDYFSRVKVVSSLQL